MSLDTERDYRSLMRILSRLFADGLSKEENLKIFRRAAALNSRRSRCGSKGGPIHASVIVCTRGRAGSLKETLLSLSAQRVPEGVNIEIVIVDNGSSDGTAAAAGTFSGESPFPVKYFLESGDGLSAARRRAVREAAGELLLFTDDDILVSPEWLFNHWNAFRETGADILGGPVLPLWESAPPRWILESGAARSRLALLDRGGSLFTTHSFDGDLIYGANMALRKSSALAAGGFSASYDRKKVQRGGDTELYERMMRSGFKAAYVPEARVLHQIPSGRLRKSYLCKVSYHGGKAKARLFGESYGFSWKKAAVDFKKAVRGLFSPAAASTDALLFLSESAGYLRERWALQAERRPLFAGTPERTPSKP